MTAFKELRKVEEVIEYQKQVLSRTGGRTPDVARLFHYTNIDALVKMVESGYIWLTSPDNMNDALEEQLIKMSGINDLYFSCFSRTNQNIAMFRMYASNPNGVMLSITVSDAKEMLSQKPRLVEESNVTEEEIDAELYWIGVCYKDLDSDRITTPGQENHHISTPLKALTGAVKLSGWEYEKEVRLCSRKRLFAGQKLAVKLPDSINVVLCPMFDMKKNNTKLAKLTAIGIHYESSAYDNWIR